MPPCLAEALREQLPFGGGGERGQIGAGDGRRVESCTRVFREPGAIAQQSPAGAATFEVGGHVIAGQDAVAIEKEQVVALGETGAGVAGAGQAEAVVGLRREPHRKAGLSGEIVDERGRAVGRTIVTDDHLESTVNTGLGRDRREHEREVAGLLKRVDDQRDVAGRVGGLRVHG